MQKYLIPIFTVLFFSLPAPAANYAVPAPGLAPDRVVDIQLDALQRNDGPGRDWGIAQAWAFAHPDNKRVTGPLERFAAMIKGPAYSPLLNHRDHDIEPVLVDDAVAVFRVTVVTEIGRVVGYRWDLSRVGSGALAGAWMTTAVSGPVPLGNAI